MRPDACHAAVKIAVEPCLERGERRPVAVVAQLRVREPELTGALGEGRRQKLECLLARRDERRAELRHLERPRLERLAR